MTYFQPISVASDRVMAALVSGLEIEFGRGAGEALVVEGQPVRDQLAQPAGERRRQHHQQRTPTGDGGKVPEVARARNLAVFTRFLDLAL